ncbi:MAG: cache domain-containing protein [Inquilinus sp.]|uniref:cache domain-containing protein n=1 Tax=Inquilinus sp. TaxID=1932117 RepID=UPI003F3579FD
MSFIAVVVPMVANGFGDAWFGYRDQRVMLDLLLRTQAASAATTIEGFFDRIEDQLASTVQQDWSASTGEQHRLDALGVLRRVPAVVSITLVDGDGIERLFVSRIDLNRTASGVDRSRDLAVSEAWLTGASYGPVTYYRGSEPFMTIGLAGNRKGAGVVVAEINLKLIWDVISAIQVGETGHAFALDQLGRIIAHPDISRVLRGIDHETSSAMSRLRKIMDTAAGSAVATRNLEGEAVIVAMAPVPGVDWTVFVEQPLSEAFASIRFALWRTGALLLAGAMFAAALAYWLAQRMTGPIRRLEEGTERIGDGELDHRIKIATGDELERLAEQFNQMAEGLQVSQERSERIARLKQFLAPQVAELVDKTGDRSVLAGQRAEVVVVFCDLRGFTAFSAQTEPQVIMRVLGEYYEALGSVITRFEATLTTFAGDGLMLLINAPVPCSDPALRAVDMAVEMQNAVQQLVGDWRSRGHALGFGVGLAMGPATVGGIGYEGRVEYTAIGNVVNLASRLCALAEDQQILADAVVAEAVRGRVSLVALGARPIKGLDESVLVYGVESQHGQRSVISSSDPKAVSANR